jgi:hypothetical protein
VHTVKQPNSEQQHADGDEEIAEPAEKAKRFLPADHKRAMAASLGGNALELGCLARGYNTGGHRRLDIVAAQHRSLRLVMIGPL